MTELVVNGFDVRLTKYKLIIYEYPDKEVKASDAALVAHYLWDEGFIKKDDFPVEIIPTED